MGQSTSSKFSERYNKKWVTYSKNTRKLSKSSIWIITSSFWEKLNIFLHRAVSWVYSNRMLEPYFLILYYIEVNSTKSIVFRLFGKSCDVTTMWMSPTLQEMSGLPISLSLPLLSFLSQFLNCWTGSGLRWAIGTTRLEGRTRGWVSTLLLPTQHSPTGLKMVNNLLSPDRGPLNIMGRVDLS